MIIQISPNRRLSRYAYGWKIEKRMVREEDDRVYWTEDRPAYPATLAAALRSCLERELAEGGDADIAEVPERLQQALKAWRSALKQAEGMAA